MTVLQQWEGIVHSVSATEFVAILYDMTDRTRGEEEATFSIDEVAEEERALVQPGAVFCWDITRPRPGKVEATLQFRQGRTRTEDEIRAIEEEVASFEEFFDS